METERLNNFALVRLLLAFAVIASHTPLLLTGDISSEPGLMLWGTLRLGQMAVDGFFLVSGYLIAQSFENSSTIGVYLWKRVLRIYPAFLVAAAFTVVVVAPLAGVPFTEPVEFIRQLAGALVLSRPVAEGAFQGVGFGDLNAPLWTIAYEFRCYVLLGLIGYLGLLRNTRFVAAVAAVFLALTATGLVPRIGVPYISMLTGALDDNIRLCGYFLTGTSFYLFRRSIDYSHALAAVAAVALFGLLFVPWLADPALALLGGYIVFWFAFKAPVLWLSTRIREDLSYGIYLYAWPVQCVLIYYHVATTEWAVTLIATLGSAVLALLSWRLIEKPALSLKSWRPQAATLAESSPGESKNGGR
ncbi:acyltransferase [Devosia ginsengisoli]|uniref:acyltransferase family protein n=1 Tax=Devosia ginsengisoli TaxID=400770 RepID=UPI0026EBC0A1|nr:acyltransferase [Devosia ginsengisoli]MCR6672055.1 acyltransferase [Devosia ginsengisoli]